jgi:hypothetical protein
MHLAGPPRRYVREPPFTLARRSVANSPAVEWLQDDTLKVAIDSPTFARRQRVSAIADGPTGFSSAVMCNQRRAALIDALHRIACGGPCARWFHKVCVSVLVSVTAIWDWGHGESSGFATSTAALQCQTRTSRRFRQSRGCLVAERAIH